MRAIFIAFLLTLTSFSWAWAAPNDSMTIDKTQVSASDLQKIQEILDKGKAVATDAKSLSENLTDPAKLNEWVELGKNLGQALASTARELGTGAAEFAKTPMGTMVTFIILWKLFASDMMMLTLATLALILGNIVLYRIHMRKTMKTSKEGLWFWRSKVDQQPIPFNEAWKDSEATIFFILLMVNNIVGIIAIFRIG